MNFKRLIEKRSAESDEVIEIMPLTIDPSFDPDFIPPVRINVYQKQENIHVNYMLYTPANYSGMNSKHIFKTNKYVLLLCILSQTSYF